MWGGQCEHEVSTQMGLAGVSLKPGRMQGSQREWKCGPMPGCLCEYEAGTHVGLASVS